MNAAMMSAMAMSPRGWWRRHPLPDSVAAPVADSHLAFGGLIAFTFILLLAPQMIVPALAVLAFIRPALFAASVAAVSYLCNRMLTGRPLTVITRELWLGAALLVWASITVPVSYWPGGSVAVLAGVFVKSLLVFWLIANVVNTPERLRRFMIVLSLAGGPLALTAILNYRAGVFMEGATAVKRITGYDAPLTQNPNDLALMLNLLVPLAIGLLLTRPRPLLRTLLFMTIGLEAVGIILTFSRAGFLAMGVTTVAWLWKFRRRRERGWVLVPDANRGHRRVVPSPVPLEIVELAAIRRLAGAGTVTAGGASGVSPASSTRSSSCRRASRRGSRIGGSPTRSSSTGASRWW